MNFPSKYDFLEAFGIEPAEEDSSMAYYRYVKPSPNGELEIDISFSAISHSFQVVLRCRGHVVATVSSEKVKFIQLRSDKSGDGIHVVFDIQGVNSEVWVKLEPEVNFHWWVLRST